MLHVGCGNCRAVVPLFCAGSFMPHMPTFVFAGPMGPQCPYCGPKPPIFTCMHCGMTQMIYIQGSPYLPPPAAPGMPRMIAPAVNAQPGASASSLNGMLTSAGAEFLKQFAGHAGGKFGDQFGSGMSDYMSTWFGGGDPYGGGASW